MGIFQLKGFMKRLFLCLKYAYGNNHTFLVKLEPLLLSISSNSERTAFRSISWAFISVATIRPNKI
jgi:hypothetical protein